MNHVHCSDTSCLNHRVDDEISEGSALSLVFESVSLVTLLVMLLVLHQVTCCCHGVKRAALLFIGETTSKWPWCWFIMRSLHDVHEMNAYRADHVCLSTRFNLRTVT
jgi:hypothetical protein